MGSCTSLFLESRVCARTGLKILITDDNSDPASFTTNVVYQEVFQKI